MKFTVIKGGRDPQLVEAETRIQNLIQRGASIRVEHPALAALTKIGLRFGQLKTILAHCRVEGFEENAESIPVINRVVGTILEELEDLRIVKEFALKVG